MLLLIYRKINQKKRGKLEIKSLKNIKSITLAKIWRRIQTKTLYMFYSYQILTYLLWEIVVKKKKSSFSTEVMSLLVLQEDETEIGDHNSSSDS
jgi:hypothetical protein